MSATPSADEILERVRRLLVDALSVDPAEVRPEARIMDDLNAESIDLLDLRFRIEKAFGLRITAEDLARAFRGTVTASEFRARFTVGALCEYLGGRLEAPGG